MPDNNLTRKQDTYSYHVLTRQFDFSEWRQIEGKVTLEADSIIMTQDSTLASYNSFLYGEFDFDIEFSATPAAGDENIFGLVSPDLAVTRGGVYLRANTSALTGYVIAEDGTTVEGSVAIPWNTDWNTARVNFGIRWGAEGVTFLANDVIIGKIKADTSQGVVIPKTPQHLILSNNGPTQTMKVYNIKGKNIGQSYLVNSGNYAFNDGYESAVVTIPGMSTDLDIEVTEVTLFTKNRQQVSFMPTAAMTVKLNADTNPAIVVAANGTLVIDHKFVSNLFVSSVAGGTVQITTF
jgi:hypothetical protein